MRLKEAWGLASWYKGLRTGPQEKAEKKPGKSLKPKKAKKTATAKKGASKKVMPNPEEVSSNTEVTVKPQEAIERYVAAHPGDIDPRKVSAALGIRVQTVVLIPSKFADTGKGIEKTQDGKFRSVHQKDAA